MNIHTQDTNARQGSNTNILNIALDYLDRGYQPVPIPFKKKGPTLEGWQTLRITKENASQYFNGKAQNIGIMMGDASNGVTDIDLDCPIARELAPALLPPTKARFGRASSPNSHWLYITDLCKTEDTSRIVFADVNKETLIEIRIGGGGKGAQTMAPPSEHPDCNERVRWEEDGEPAKYDGQDLIKCVSRLAAAVLLIRNYPKNQMDQPSITHRDANVLAGVLARNGIERDDTIEFCRCVYELSGDVKVSDGERYSGDAWDNFHRGGPTPGMPRLTELWGSEVAKRFYQWMGFNAGSDLEVEELNKTFAFVIAGNKAAILEEQPDNSFRLLPLDTFNASYENKFKTIGDKKVPLAKYWREHPQRRQYTNIVFSPEKEIPGTYNLWKGFTVQPRPGDCSKFLAHIRDNVCQGKEDRFNWVMGWFASIVQHPATKCETSLGLRGKEGVGKTKVGEVMKRILGRHYISVADPRYITGQFNSHMLSCLLLHSEEAFWAGDKKAEGKLKDLITGKTHPVEFKGRDSIWVDNYIRLLVTSNETWMAPVGKEGRRFTVLDVADTHMQDKPYFIAIDEEMKNGGTEALLHYLLHFDLSVTDIRKVLNTSALTEQKLSSLTPEESWLFDLVSRGYMPYGTGINAHEPLKADIFNSYITYAKKLGIPRRSSETKLGIFLVDMIPGITSARPKVGAERKRIYRFPSLDECRLALGDKMQLPDDYEWDGCVSWCVEEDPDRFEG